MANLQALIQKRGYVKGTITRLLDNIEEGDLASNTVEMIAIKKQRCLAAFNEYELCNTQILAIDPDNNEDVGSYEKASMAQSYQLERDMKTEPKVDHFLAFLEKRALAMENAEPARDKVPARSVNAVTTKDKQCYYCVTTQRGAADKRDAVLRVIGLLACRAPAERLAAAVAAAAA